MQERYEEQLRFYKCFKRKYKTFSWKGQQYAIIARYYSSHWWNPFDWYIAKIIKRI